MGCASELIGVPFGNLKSLFSLFLICFMDIYVKDRLWLLSLTNSLLQVELTAPDEEIASGCPLKSFKFFKTKGVPTSTPSVKTGSLNTRTPWW